MENINIIIDNVQLQLIKKIFSQFVGNILISSDIIDAIKLSPDEINEIIQNKPKKRLITIRKRRVNKISETACNEEAKVNEQVIEKISIAEQVSSEENLEEESKENVIYRTTEIPVDIDAENWRYDGILYLVDKKNNYVYCRKQNKLLGIRSFNEDREVYYIDSLNEDL